MDDHEAVLAREEDDLLEKHAVHAHGRWVVRERKDQQLRFRPRQLRGLFQPGEEVSVRRQRDGSEIAVGDDHRVGVDRIGRVRHQRAVARLQNREGEVGEPLLGAERRDRLGLGVELDAVPVAVPAGDRDAQPCDAAGGRVAVVLGVLGGLDQLRDDVLGRPEVGIAHAEIDDVLTAGARLRLEVVDDREDIRRKPLDPVELVHRTPL